MNKPNGTAQPASTERMGASKKRRAHKHKPCTGSERNKPCADLSKGRDPIRKRSNKPTYRGSSRPKRRKDQAVYAALDLGTNNCRLLVARPTRRGFLVIDAFSRIIRLGEGLSRSGFLSEDAMSRTIEALKVCSGKMANRGVHRSRLIATEACRIAENGEEFINRVKSETGLQLDIINRETEARLAVSGCASLIDRNCDWALIFDIGGGSSELIWLDLSKISGSNKARRTLHDRVETQNSIYAWTSLPIGVVKLAEKFGGSDITEDLFERMVKHVLDLLQPFEDEYQITKKLQDRNVHFLGTSGTVTTLAGIHLGLSAYDRSRVDGIWMETDSVRSVTNNLIGMSYKERVAQPCVGSERADLVLAGCAILEALMRMWPSERLRIADRGLREGILAVLMAEDLASQKHQGSEKTG